MNKTTITRLINVALLLLIALTLIFIYAQSMKPEEVSKADSDKVSEIVGEIIPPTTKPGAYLQNNIRKVAHFTEFFLLGTEIGIYIVLFMRKYKTVLLSYPLGLILAFFDESIQILSDRGPMISDVWVDLFGFSTAITLVYAVLFTAMLLYGKYILKRSKNG